MRMPVAARGLPPTPGVQVVGASGGVGVLRPLPGLGILANSGIGRRRPIASSTSFAASASVFQIPMMVLTGPRTLSTMLFQILEVVSRMPDQTSEIWDQRSEKVVINLSVM